ncbi:MAG: endonuclease III [Firmicutes bacterium]|nr:endonuclease III [Bacillota bacterium]
MSILSGNNKNKVCEVLIKEYPQAKCALDYDTEYHLLVAVMLSAQTTDVSVNKVTPRLFELAPDAYAMCELSQGELEDVIRQIGLYRNKAKNILAMSRELCANYGGRVPGNYDELIALPGVGRKTANVVLAEAFHQQRIAVDTHVFRLANRIGLVSEKDVLRTEEALMKAIPEELWVTMHHALIFHGRNCCTARNPMCESCCIAEYCKKNGLN